MQPLNNDSREPSRNGHGRAFVIVWFSATAGVLAAMLPLYLVAEVPDVGRSSAWVLTMAVLVWSGLRLSFLIVGGQPRLFEFFFWLFCYIFMGIAPTVQIRSDLVSRTTKAMDPALDQPAALIVCLGIFCFEIGVLVRCLIERRRATDSAVRVPRGVDVARTVMLAAAGLAASAYFISKVGLSGVFGTRDAAFVAREHAWPDPAMRSVFYALAIYPMLIVGGALSQLRRSTSLRAHRTTIVLGMSLCLVMLLIIVNPLASARYSLGTVLFAIAVYLGAVTTTSRSRVTLAATLGGLLFLFPLADAFRNGVGTFIRSGFFGEYKGNPDYDAFWQVANALSYWIDGLVQPLRQLLGSLLFWVPRSMWSDKPIDTGILLAQYRGYDFQNLSAPMWAELLVNGGVAAVVVGFLLIGYVLRGFDTKLLPALSAGGVWAIAGAVFPVYMTILMRGSLLQATGTFAVALVCVMFVLGKQRVQTVTESA